MMLLTNTSLKIDVSHWKFRTQLSTVRNFRHQTHGTEPLIFQTIVIIESVNNSVFSKFSFASLCSLFDNCE